MLGHRELTMQDYVGMLKRRFWLILASAILFLAIGFGISHVLPPQYISQTLVIIEQQKVPENYVKPVVTEDLGQRLASMKEQILSRSRLEPIITKFNLFAGNNSTMDDRIDQTRKGIGIAPIRSEQVRGTNGMPGFFISFTAPDAHTAQQVCAEITSLFVSENLSAREQSAEGTTEFLKQQLSDSKRNLDEQDAKFAAFQQKYFGKLPEQEGTNANTLQALTTQLDAATQSLNRMMQEETFLQAIISQQTHELQSSAGKNSRISSNRSSRSRICTHRTILTWLRSRAGFPICRPRSRMLLLSRRRPRHRLLPLVLTRRIFRNSRFSFAECNLRLPPQSRNRLN